MAHDATNPTDINTDIETDSSAEADAWTELPVGSTDPGTELEDDPMRDEEPVDRAALFIAEAEHLEADHAQGLAWDKSASASLVEFTVVENERKRLAKSYRAGAPGEPPIQNEAPRTSYGRFIRVQCNDVAGLAACLESLSFRQAIMAASLPGTVRQRRMIFHARYQALPAELRDDPAGPLYRGAVFQYQRGQAGLLSLDVDLKDLPPWLRTALTLGFGGDLCQLLASIDPAWAKILRVERGSSSSGVTDTRSGVTLKGGRHIFTVAADGADIPRYVRVLHDRLILNGLGYGFVAEGGRFEVRTLIDLVASGSPYWLIFEADAVLTDGCLRYAEGARTATWREGAVLDTSRLRDLSGAEQEKLASIKAALRAKAEPEIRRRRLDKGAPVLASLQAAGLSAAAAEQHVLAAAEAGLLPVNGIYTFDNDPLGGGQRRYTGAQMLQAVERFNGVTGADPLEPEYGGGRNKALWYVHPSRRGLWCFSFAHGGRRYQLGYDAADLIQLWRGSGMLPFEERLGLFAQACKAFVPVDHAAAEALLTEADLPAVGAFVMDLYTRETVTPAGLLERVREADWPGLAALAVSWRAVFAVAWHEARQNSGGVPDWIEVEAALATAIEAEKAGVAEERAAARPQLLMYPSETVRLVDAGEAALVAQKAPVFARGLVLVRPGHTAGRTSDGHEVSVPSLVIMNDNAAMREELAKVADWFAPPDGRRKSKTPRLSYPNELIAATLLQRRGRWTLPPCFGVLSAPTLRPDLSILDTPGLDPVTHLYVSPEAVADVQLWPCLAEPTEDDARRGLKLLKQLLVEVPFSQDDSGISQVVGLSSLMSVIIRPAMPLVPLYAFDGPQQGQGKSFITTIISTITTGLPCPVITLRKGDKAELDKALDVQLINGRPIIAIDNVVGKLQSAKLSAALTANRLEVRFLGLSRSAEIDHTATFFASGNRMKLSDDMGRRSFRAYLDNRLENAMLRQYRYDPLAMIRADRGAYLSAAIAIVRWYASAGMPGRLPRLASYGAWSDLVRSALVALGEADPVAGMLRDIDASPRRQKLRAVIAGVLEAYPLGPRNTSALFTAKELATKADENQELTLDGVGKRVEATYPRLREALVGLVDQRSAQPHHSLGVWLKNNTNQTLDGMRICRLEGVTHDKQTQWQVCRVSQSETVPER
jgi:putative DNA primase/helicase